MHRNNVGIAILSLLLAGCAGPDPLTRDFGESVRHMIRVQTDNPGYSAGAGLDGERAERALGEYRTGRKASASPISSGM